MRETAVQRAERAAVLVFIAAVTTVLLAFVFGQAARGVAGVPAVLVYAFAAGFGLEFLGSAWTGGWRQRSRRRQLHSWCPLSSATPPTPGSDADRFAAAMEARRTDTLRASPRMFESNLLDRLSRVHPVVPPLVFSPLIAVMFALGQEGTPALEVVAWLAGGWVFWTLTEYWMHRLVFHLEPEKGVGARLHWIIHGVHHDHPNDPMRLVMPPSVSVPLAAGFYGLFVLVLGTPVAHLFAAGFLAGYLGYDMTHYHLHHHKPRTRLGKLLYELHMRHHFQDDTRGFGVSAPFWDYAFGTPQDRSARR